MTNLVQSVHCLSVPYNVPFVGSVSLSPLRFLESVHCLSVPYTVMSVGSVSLCPLLSSTRCPLPVSSSYCTVGWFCVTMKTAFFHSLSTACQYFAMYRQLAFCHYVQCFLPRSVDCLSVPYTVPSVVSVSLCPLLSFTVCPMSVNNLHCNGCWFWVNMSNAFFYSLSIVCQYFTLYR